MTTDLASLRNADVIVVVLGTLIDQNCNPTLDGLLRFIDDLCPLLREGPRIVLRSTVSPGTTDRVKRIIERKTGMTEGVGFYLVYAPERTLQCKALTEIKDLPHIIGAYSEESSNEIGKFFSTFRNLLNTF